MNTEKMVLKVINWPFPGHYFINGFVVAVMINIPIFVLALRNHR